MLAIGGKAGFDDAIGFDLDVEDIEAIGEICDLGADERAALLQHEAARGGRAIALRAQPRIALQLHIFPTSESMGHHDSEVMDDWIIDRSDA